MKSFLDELKLELRRTSSIINFMLRWPKSFTYLMFTLYACDVRGVFVAAGAYELKIIIKMRPWHSESNIVLFCNHCRCV